MLHENHYNQPPVTFFEGYYVQNIQVLNCLLITHLNDFLVSWIMQIKLAEGVIIFYALKACNKQILTIAAIPVLHFSQEKSLGLCIQCRKYKECIWHVQWLNSQWLIKSDYQFTTKVCLDSMHWYTSINPPLW